MRPSAVLTVAALVAVPILVINATRSGTSQAPRLNPMIALHEAGQPIFGLYAPRAGRGEEARSPLELAQEAVAYKRTDFIFDGSMEGSFERGYPGFSEFARGMKEAGFLQTGPAKRLTHPLVVKMHEIAPDPAAAVAHIGQQLDLGVSTVVFVGVESAEELRTGIQAMRYAARGGTRAESVGMAPEMWGMSAEEYRRRADLWPLNPEGELVAWAIVESPEGLAHVEEIAAVPGAAVIFPGAGTLRGLFTTRHEDGTRTLDEAAWEASIQRVLAACKAAGKHCGYPANENDIEERMRQGFDVFIMGWGEAGFRAIDKGRAAAGRAAH